LQSRPVRKPPVGLQQKPIRRKSPLEYDPEYMPSDWYDPLPPDEEYLVDPDEPEQKPFSELSEEQKQQIFDRVLGNVKRKESKESELAKRITRKLRQAKDKREDRELAQAMRDLTIDDNSMDIDVMRSRKLELEEDDDGNIYVVRAGIKKK
jgi:hypothetical protein